MQADLAVKRQTNVVWHRQRGIAVPSGAQSRRLTPAPRRPPRALFLVQIDEASRKRGSVDAQHEAGTWRVLGRMASALGLDVMQRECQLLTFSAAIDAGPLLHNLWQRRALPALTVVLTAQSHVSFMGRNLERGTLNEFGASAARVLISHSLAVITANSVSKREAWAHMQAAIAFLRSTVPVLRPHAVEGRL